jgi:hypothetical protein
MVGAVRQLARRHQNVAGVEVEVDGLLGALRTLREVPKRVQRLFEAGGRLPEIRLLALTIDREANQFWRYGVRRFATIDRIWGKGSAEYSDTTGSSNASQSLKPTTRSRYRSTAAVSGSTRSAGAVRAAS